MFTVRGAGAEDAAEVAGVHVRSWQAAYRGLLSDEYLDALRPEDRMGYYILGAPDPSLPSTIVAVMEGTIRGFATTGPSRDADTPDRGEVLALYVDPDAWGLGVGRALLAQARTHLHRSGFVEAVLWVLVGNDRAQRFYRADRWMADGHGRQLEVWGVVVDEIRYRRHLP